MKLERVRGRDERASWRTGMSSHAEGEQGSAVGSLLRASRLRCGEEIAEVAQNLRIRQAYLQALEDGRFENLPGPAYAVGFVRTYAEHLGLAGEEVVRRFKAEASGINRATELVFPSPVAEGGVPGGALLLVGVLLAGLAYGGWYMLSTKDRIVAEVVPALPDRLVALVEQVRNSLQPTPLPPSQPGDAPAVDKAATTPRVAEAPVAAAPLVAPASTPSVSEPSTATWTEEEAEATEPEVEFAGSADGAEEETLPATDVPAAPMTQVQSETVPATMPVASAMAAVAEPKPARPAAPAAAIPPPPEVSTAAVHRASNVPSATAADSPFAARAAEAPAAPAMTANTLEVQIASLPAGPTATGDGRLIVVRAKTDSWIQVRDETDNRLLLTRLLHAGDTYDVPNRPGLMLLTGNAGALEITIDGQVAPSIGPIGAVRRNVALDADKLLEGTASNP